MLVYLEFEVKNMSVARKSTDKTPLISGSVDHYGLHIEFDPAFSEIPGIKAVEFIKKNNKERLELIDGKCAIPNWILTDKDTFQIRVVSGTTTGTTWQQVAITEGGIIMPEKPEEEAPIGTEYVKTLSGEYSVALIRSSTNGLEYSTDGGETWNSGVSGVPEVPARPKDAAYLRKNGDWVSAEEYLAENGGEANAIDEVKVNGEALPIEEKSVNIDLSEYAKTADLATEYATKTEVSELQTLTGTAETISELDYSTDDISAVVTAFNGLVEALKSRGVIS